MHTYDDEIYAYLTQPANYRSAKQIASQLGMVDDRLVGDFWVAVQKALRSTLDQQQPAANWQVKLSPGQWLSVHLADWEHMGVNCDTLLGCPDFGLHCDEKFYDRAAVNKLLDEKMIRQTENLTKHTPGWPCYRHLSEFDFRQQQTMERILPGQREETVRGIVALFVDFVDKHQVILKRIYSETRKPVNF